VDEQVTVAAPRGMMTPVSRYLGNPGVQAPPVAVRTTTPGWRDPRLWIGVAIVAVSVVAGARLLASADDTVAVWAVVDDMGAGDLVSETDLEVRRVRFADDGELERYFRADDQLPADLQLSRGVGAGELLPRAAVGATADADRLQVAIEVPPGRVPPSVSSGAVVDVFVLDNGADEPRGRARDHDGPALAEVTVVDAPEPDASFGSTTGLRQIVLAVPEQEVADFHALLDSVQDPVISVVRRP
jgi:hypothetical protein